MNKSEIKKAADSELIVQLAEIYAKVFNSDTNRCIKRKCIELDYLTHEMVRRGLISSKQMCHLLYD
jgi:hypothetical protein